MMRSIKTNSSVPMSIPTGFPPQNCRDGWADYDQTTGFEREARRHSALHER